MVPVRRWILCEIIPLLAGGLEVRRRLLAGSHQPFATEKRFL
jgi:hypothetical protein